MYRHAYLWTAAALAAVLAPAAPAVELHVAPNGSDANPGTAARPLRTIQAAAERMKAGDACTIRTGVYRETVKPAADGTPEAPLLFRAAPGERVVVSGLDPVSGWQRVDANVVRAPVGWDLGKNNQVFLDGKLMVEARWPNRKGDDPFAPEGARADYEGSSFDRLRCPAFPANWSAEPLAGATVWCMAQWRWSSWTAPVTGYDPATRTLTVKGHDTWWVKEKHNPGTPAPLRQGKGIYEPAEFVVSGTRFLLDAPGEWFLDAKEGQLYLFLPAGADPAKLHVEAKRRLLAFDLTGRAHVQVRGIDCAGATVTLKDARDCVVSGMRATHVSHTRGGSTQAALGEATGLFVSGSGNVIRDSEIAGSSGAGVTVEGERNAVTNCFIHDTDTIGAYACCVNLRGSRHLISHNTLRDTGRDCIQFQGQGHLIQYNDISGAGRICHDTGAVYQGGTDGEGAEIRYNWVHDVAAGLGNGLYLDNYTANYLVHHNVVWGVSYNALQLNQPSGCVMAFHNTLFGRMAATYSPWKGQKTMFGSLLANNLVAEPSQLKEGYTEVATVRHGLSAPEGGFDPQRHVSAAGVDQGVRLPGINDGFTGRAPDCGAYEAGRPLWRPGHDFAHPPEVSYQPVDSFYRSYLANGSFERPGGVPGGPPSAWSVAAGSVNLQHHPGFNDPPADGRFSVHGNSLYLTGDADAGVEQRVDGLKPGAEYVFAAYVRLESVPAAAKDVVLAVRGMQGELGSVRWSATDAAVWRHVEVTFRTAEAGPVTVSIRKEGAGDAYVDLAGLAPVWQAEVER